MTPTNFIFFLHIITISIMFPQTTSISLPMIPIDSSQLQIVPQSLTTQQRHQFLMNISLSRASLYPKRKGSNSSVNSLESTVWWRLSNFFVTQVFFGTSSNLFGPYLLLDSGDDNTWVQCDGCNPCFEVSGGNPRVQDSLTYKLLSVDDPRCNPRYIYDQSCGFLNEYAGGRVSSSGPVGTDTFLFINSQTQKPDFIQDLAFGCGLINRNINFGQNDGPQNTIAGLFGLSPGPRSFLNQLDAQIQGKFSFCLTSWAEPELGKSTMYFGDAAQIEGPNVQQIPMDSTERYHLYFSGISVDGNRLSIEPSICALTDGDASKGTGFFVDSGAPTTILPQTAYQPLRLAMVNYFAQYGWQTIEGQTFDLCYTSTPEEGQNYPSVVFHFSKGDQGGEVDWTMDKDNMFVRFDQIDGFCMVVGQIPDPGPCLLGAYQLANFKISFDVKNAILSFAPQRCQENTL